MRAQNLSILEYSEEIAFLMAEKIVLYSRDPRDAFHIALTSNPIVLRILEIISSDDFKHSIVWERLHFWWVDETCFAADGRDNFFYFNDRLFSRVALPKKNIHRIYGDADPKMEILRYKHELVEFVPIRDNYPCFDLLLLDLGEDGHVASLYPEIIPVPNASTQFTCVVQDPHSGQLKVSLLLDVLNNAQRVFFLISGEERADTLYHIFKMDAISMSYPASYIDPAEGIMMWLVDRAAASKIQRSD
ncbi:MAG: 6-phosphogluconolactonase [Fibrobacterales bacterium]